MPQRFESLDTAVLRALGELRPLLNQPGVRDILITVRNEQGQLWVDVAGKIRQVRGWSADGQRVRRLAVELIAAAGRHLDELQPCADAHIGEGIRVHAVLPPVAVNGTVVSIRLPQAEAPSLVDLLAGGLCTPVAAHWLEQAIALRYNFIISGATGSGKTTLLAALLGTVPAHERILTIEDVAELRIRHPHHVALEVRQATAEGAGAVSLDQLLAQALRMRPDRIVLGECRGAEVMTLFTAFNTGHDGGAGTLHASSLADVPARLEALGALAGVPEAAVVRQANSALDAAIHVMRDANGVHRVAEIGWVRLQRQKLVIESVPETAFR